MRRVITILCVSASFAASAEVVINETTFPCPNFRTWILEQQYGEDGILTDDEIANVKTIKVVGKEISDLSGIEFFSRLESLFCSDNCLTSFDGTGLPRLQVLDCHSNKISTLNICHNTELRSLICFYNNLTELDVTESPELRRLLCQNNQIRLLDLSVNALIDEINCESNRLTSVILPENPENLYYFNFCDNQINSENTTALLSSLPAVVDGFLVVKSLNSTSDTNMTIADFSKIAKEKGWYVFAKKSMNAYVSHNAEDLPDSPYFDNNPLPVNNNTLKVLAIGNSLVGDSLSYLADLVSAAGINSKDLCVYRVVKGSSTLTDWLAIYKAGTPLSANKATCSLRVGRIDYRLTSDNTLAEILSKDWDVIVLNEKTNQSYEQAKEAINDMISVCRTHCTNPAVALAWHGGWSREKTKCGYEGGSEEHWAAIQELTVEQMCHAGIDVVIPTGTAIQIGRATNLSPEGELTRDGVHILLGAGRYIASATWFETIIAPVFGISVSGNTALHDKLYSSEITDDELLQQLHATDPVNNLYFPPVFVTEANRRLCQQCVMRAMEDVWSTLVEYDPSYVELTPTDKPSRSGIRYNTLGQRVGDNCRGVVIEDGKKILVR